MTTAVPGHSDGQGATHAPAVTTTSENQSHDTALAPTDHGVETFLGTLGYRADDRLAICYPSTSSNGLGHEHATATDAPGVVARHADGDVWFSVCPLREGRIDGRGGAADVAGIRALWADLDDKNFPGARTAVAAVIDDLTAVLGAAPAAVVSTGHGMHPWWALDPEDELDFEPGSQRATKVAALVRRFGRLVAAVATRHGGSRDNVYDLARIMRVPGTVNRKPDLEPVPVTVTYPGGAALTLDGLELVLDEQGIEETPQRPAPTMDAPATSDDLDDAERDRRLRYCTAAIESEVARLDAMSAAKTPDGTGYTGPPWDATTYAGTCSLLEIANTPGSGLTTDEAAQLVRDHAPRDGGFDDARVEEKIESARRTVGTKGRTIAAQPVDPFGDPAPTTTGPRDPFESAATPTGQISALERMKGRIWQDSHVAEAFAEHHADELRYVEGLGFLRWSNLEGRWALISEHVAVGMSNVFAQALMAEAGRTGDADLTKRATARLTRAAIKNVVDLVKGNSLIIERVENLDAHPTLLNTPSGVVDLRTGELLPHNRDLMLTKSTADPYVPGATHPDLDKALEALPGHEERDFAQERFGQALIGSPPKEDYLLLLKGGGANSKTTLVGSLGAALGGYFASITGHMLMSGMEKGHTTELVDFRGARLALAEELPDGTHLSEKRIKDLVGTPVMKGRRMREDNIEWRASHTLVATTNTWPRITGTDHGIRRRLEVLVFPYRYVATPAEATGEHDRLGDLGLKPRMLGTDREHGPYPQREAVLAWAVEGARRYLARGDQPTPIPASSQAAKREWLERSDTLGTFLSERVEAAAGWVIPTTDLLEGYNEYLEARGHNKLASQTFTTRLDEHPMLPDGASRGRAQVTTEANHPSRSRVSYRPIESGALGTVHRTYEDGQKVSGYQGMRWVLKVSDE
ncbi:DNA primase family protein [Janibacter melonis]|uniref:DNA primase family protein n=1 Tax=Janibacter melonis TaxID=262209 RepID=UPI00174E66BE|nr:phage/plasmid primase, P4 family [Janibacter melonis]